MSFPSSPSNGQTAILNGITYAYNSVNGTWKRVASSAAYSGALTSGAFATPNTINSSFTIPTGTNAMSVGPITVASSATIVLQAGQRWIII